MASFRSGGNRFDRTIIHAGIIFGDPDNETGNDQTDKAAQIKVEAVKHLIFNIALGFKANHGIGNKIERH